MRSSLIVHSGCPSGQVYRAVGEKDGPSLRPRAPVTAHDQAESLDPSTLTHMRPFDLLKSKEVKAGHHLGQRHQLSARVSCIWTFRKATEILLSSCPGGDPGVDPYHPQPGDSSHPLHCSGRNPGPCGSQLAQQTEKFLGLSLPWLPSTGCWGQGSP